MDCRKSLWLALSLALAGGGCTSGPDLKARTEVAFADFRVRDAASRSDILPAQKEAELDRARIAYKHALEIDPDCKEAYAGLGNMYAALGNTDRAVQIYTQALQKYPRDAFLWFNLGMCQCRKKDLDAGLASLKKAQGLDPDNRVFVRTLGLALARAGRCQESEACLKQVMSPAEAQYTVARMLHHVGQDEQSRQYCQRALQANPDLAGARQLYAVLQGEPQPSGGRVVSLGFSADGLELGARD
jgi:tetratricopeptide (TPR) repeat protein